MHMTGSWVAVVTPYDEDDRKVVGGKPGDRFVESSDRLDRFDERQ